MEFEAPAPVVETLAPVVVPAGDPTTQADADAITETQSLETFAEKHPRRHRARSQQAGPDDVPRIAELTKKLRETETELAALKTPVVAPVVPPAQSPASSQARPAVAPAPPPVIAADKDPEPTETLDPSTQKPYEDFTKFVRDHGRWAARDEMRTARTAWEKQTAEETAAAEQTRLSESWATGVQAAKQQHKDFEAVAFGTAPWAKGSLIDRWIAEHPAGPLVLYALKKDPAQATAMLAMSLFEQTEALSLLSQRLRPSQNAAAVPTGAVPVHPVTPVPRPPTPVRTGPLRTEPAAPDPEALSLDDFAEATGFSGRRR